MKILYNIEESRTQVDRKEGLTSVGMFDVITRERASL